MLGRESDFEELSQIGKGGYSSVFKCRNKLDNRLYALKKISLEKPKNSKAFKAEYNKVLEEVRHLCMLEHPNIVRYYGCWLSMTQETSCSDAKTRHTSDKKQQELKCSKVNITKDPLKKACSRSESVKGEDVLIIERPLELCMKEESFESNLECHNAESLYFMTPDNLSHEEEVLPRPKLSKNMSSQEKSLKKRRGLLLSDIMDSKANISTITEKIDFYIQTELCDQTLRDYLDKRNIKIKQNPTDTDWIKQAFSLAKQMVQGLLFLSTEKIVHRDIKPSNIFLSQDLHLKYGDFGLVKSCKDQSGEVNFIPTPILSPTINEFHFDPCFLNDTSAGFSDTSNFDSCRKRERRYSCFDDDINYDLTKKVGTTMYASPEQMSSAKYTKKTDYYSLGLVLVEIFLPLHTEMEKFKVFDSIRKHERIDKEILGGKFPQLSTVLSRLVKRDSSQRPALDDLLLLLQAEELRFLKTLKDEVLGPVWIRWEGEADWKEKRIIILQKKVYFYSQLNYAKAEAVVSLDNFKICLQRDNVHSESDQMKEMIEIEFSSQATMGLSLRVESALGDQLFQRLMREMH